MTKKELIEALEPYDDDIKIYYKDYSEWTTEIMFLQLDEQDNSIDLIGDIHY